METGGADRLVIDLRRNGGGDNTTVEPLRHRIGRTHFNRSGGLYVLIGPRTFSAAQNLATRLERETFAVFVGEPTGGRPNHFGDPLIKTFAPSDLRVFVSSVRWSDSPPSDQRPWIFPDLFTPVRFEDWRAGRDSDLEAALTHSSDEAADDGRFQEYWSRESQKGVWRPFWLEGR